MDRAVYYRMLTDSRTNTLDERIKYFLHTVCVQTAKHIGYIDALNALYKQYFLQSLQLFRCLRRLAEFAPAGARGLTAGRTGSRAGLPPSPGTGRRPPA